METPTPASLPTFVDLLQRCVDEPGKHLEEQSCVHFDAYLFGYSATGRLRGTECLPNSFEAALEQDFGIRNLKGYSFSHWSFLVAALGEPGALHRKLEYLKALYTPVQTFDVPSRPKDLLSLLDKDGGIRQRPTLYLGNGASSVLLWSLISGSCWAEIDAGVQAGPINHFFIGFQAWIEKKYPFSRGIPWGRTLLLVTMNCSKSSVDAFFRHHDSYAKQLKRKKANKAQAASP